MSSEGQLCSQAINQEAVVWWHACAGKQAIHQLCLETMAARAQNGSRFREGCIHWILYVTVRTRNEGLIRISFQFIHFSFQLVHISLQFIHTSFQYSHVSFQCIHISIH